MFALCIFCMFQYTCTFHVPVHISSYFIELKTIFKLICETSLYEINSLHMRPHFLMGNLLTIEDIKNFVEHFLNLFIHSFQIVV